MLATPIVVEPTTQLQTPMQTLYPKVKLAAIFSGNQALFNIKAVERPPLEELAQVYEKGSMILEKSSAKYAKRALSHNSSFAGRQVQHGSLPRDTDLVAIRRKRAPSREKASDAAEMMDNMYQSKFVHGGTMRPEPKSFVDRGVAEFEQERLSSTAGYGDSVMGASNDSMPVDASGGQLSSSLSLSASGGVTIPPPPGLGAVMPDTGGLSKLAPPGLPNFGNSGFDDEVKAGGDTVETYDAAAISEHLATSNKLKFGKLEKAESFTKESKVASGKQGLATTTLVPPDANSFSSTASSSGVPPNMIVAELVIARKRAECLEDVLLTHLANEKSDESAIQQAYIANRAIKAAQEQCDAVVHAIYKGNLKRS